MSRKAYRIGLLLVIGFAFTLRLGVAGLFVGLSTPPDVQAQPDQRYYESLAYTLATEFKYGSPEPTAIVVPGSSLTLFPIYLLFGHSYAAGRVWWCLLSALTCLGVALTVQPIWGKVVALFAALMMAVYPNHFYYAIHFVTETPYTCYMAAALACTSAALQKQSSKLHGIAGLFWGAAALTRAQIVLIIPLAFLWGLITWCKPYRWRFFHAWAIQSAVLLLILSPWIVRNVVVIGQPVLSTYSGHTLLQSHNDLIFNDPAYREYRGSWLRDSEKLKALYPLEGDTLLERDQAARHYALESIRRNLDKMPGLLWAKGIKFITPLHPTPNLAVKIAFASGWIVVGTFSLLGMWYVWHQQRWMMPVLCLPILTTLTTCLLFHAEARYRDSAAPAFIILAAIGMLSFRSQIAAYIAKRRPNKSPITEPDNMRL